MSNLSECCNALVEERLNGHYCSKCGMLCMYASPKVIIRSWKDGAWKDELRFVYGSMYIQNEYGEFCLVRNEIDFLIEDIERLLEETKIDVLEDLKDYVFINDRKGNQKVTWGDLKHYIKEMEKLYKFNSKNYGDKAD